MQLNCFPGDESALAAVVVVDDEALLAAGEGGERLDGDVAAAPALVQEGVVHREPGGNCIKIGLTGKSILRDCYQENRTSRRPFLLLRISFPGRTTFTQFIPGALDDCVHGPVAVPRGVDHAHARLLPRGEREQLEHGLLLEVEAVVHHLPRKNEMQMVL